MLAHLRPIHRLGLVSWLLYSAVMHAWAVLIASRAPESGGVVSTALLPVFSWFRLALTLPDEYSQVRGPFATSLVAWLVCASLLVTARRLNRHARELRRTDRTR